MLWLLYFYPFNWSRCLCQLIFLVHGLQFVLYHSSFSLFTFFSLAIFIKQQSLLKLSHCYYVAWTIHTISWIQNRCICLEIAWCYGIYYYLQNNISEMKNVDYDKKLPMLSMRFVLNSFWDENFTFRHKRKKTLQVKYSSCYWFWCCYVFLVGKFNLCVRFDSSLFQKYHFAI